MATDKKWHKTKVRKHWNKKRRQRDRRKVKR